MKLLHIVASPRSSRSRTLTISNAFLHQLLERCPETRVQTRDLFAQDLPPVDGQNMDSKYRLMMGSPIDPGHAESWIHIEALIAEFLEADVYLVTAPMWNFSIPYVLKYYIDAIVQPRYLFAYDESGTPVGLVKNKRMVLVTTRGGDYSLGSPMNAYDAQESYLRQIFGFVGITDLRCIHAQPMDLAPAMRATALSDATRVACLLADELAEAPLADAGAVKVAAAAGAHELVDPSVDSTHSWPHRIETS